MAEYETLIYEERDGVAWITMNRPDVHNAFNHQMQRELKATWRSLRHNDDIRCVVLTGAGEKAFCTGIDRTEVMGGWDGDPKHWTPAVPDGERSDSQFHFDDPGENIGPKANDLWKPVIAAVNGMACGGAFYMLGEVDFVIAADHATFFDPHTTFGMAAVFESMHMLQKLPFHELMRIALVGSSERLSAQRAYTLGLVTELVPVAELHDAADRVAKTIAAAPAAAIEGTVRAIWAANDMNRRDALDMGKVLIKLATVPSNLHQGQEAFASGKREKPRLR
jgi:enoyl-CoA hydratase/carnithine racemase